ncbi:MAG: DUF892 family protein [Acidobacteriales bacterium]|nr:DUF892 family protein [Terriglobales bacterium]
MKLESMQDLFVLGLKHMYDCEQKLVKKGLPAMIKASQSAELRTALEQHLRETETHVQRLERVFGALGETPDTKDNDVFDEMSNETEDMISATEASALRDAALIACGNEVEHYEMAVYGSLISWGEQLGLDEAVTMLESTLEEEKAADAKLTQIGEQSVNREAGLRAA